MTQPTNLLPEDIWNLTSNYLDGNSIKNLTQTCKCFDHLLEDKRNLQVIQQCQQQRMQNQQKETQIGQLATQTDTSAHHFYTLDENCEELKKLSAFFRKYTAIVDGVGFTMECGRTSWIKNYQKEHPKATLKEAKKEYYKQETNGPDSHN